MEVLLCGHRSHAAKGLLDMLTAAGHHVTCFVRGAMGQSGDIVSGPVAQIDENPHLQRPFDVLVNYIVLKDLTVDPNVAFVAALVRLCQKQAIKHFIHISSVSSYKSSVRVLTEDAAVEPNPLKKGSYGSLKAATDMYILAHIPAATKVSMFRPGFILGPSIPNPIIGTATRAPWNKVLVMGTGKATFPMMKRDNLSRAVVKVIADPPAAQHEILLLCANNSPTRYEFLAVCCKRFGAGRSVMSLPVPLWWLTAVGAEITLRILGQGALKPYDKLTARLRKQGCDSTKTQQRLGFSLDFDWASELVGSLPAQQPNFSLPYPPPPALAAPGLSSLNIVGYGRIIKQKHLPALPKIGFQGAIRAYDVQAGKDANGQEIQALSAGKLTDADLTILATPGPFHTQAIDTLRDVRGTILIEKPLCYSPAEYDAWQAFAAGRPKPIYVCHNYRYKGNVLEMIDTLRQYNPGRLLHVHCDYQSPPLAGESAAWMREERKVRTLVMDYGLHFLDLATLFGQGAWKIDQLDYALDGHGLTSLIQGAAHADNYPISFILRQGFNPRRLRLYYTFQNYQCSIGFFPDTFLCHMTNDMAWIYKAEAKKSSRAMFRKIVDKLTGKDADLSHPRVIAAAATGHEALAGCAVERLRPFYNFLFDLAARVYT